MKRQIILSLIGLLLCPIIASGRNYSATFTGNDLRSTLSVLTKATGYDFVYQAELAGKIDRTVSGEYVDLPLQMLLDLTLTRQLGLNYKIVDKTISLSKAPPAAPLKGIVSGTVLDEEGQPLAGATVTIKDSQLGIAADIDGNFSLPIDMPAPVLTVHYVGMRPYELPLNNTNIASPIRIVMKRDATLMSEVVVTGYQNIKRENATGAFQVISAKDIDSRTLYSLQANLEGKVAGLVSRNDEMQIRGVGTLSASRSPLIVVDGLPISGTLDEVNPYDVEKITVLKDAAAAAVYGARASNGVIVITSKKSTSDRLQVSLNADLNFIEKRNYDDTRMVDGAGLLQLEENNFNWIMAHDDPAEELEYQYSRRGKIWKPFNRLMWQHHAGEISDDEYNRQRAIWSRNNYRKEWQDYMEHTRLQQTYNLNVRNRGKYLSSNLTVNWHGDNTQLKNQYNNNLLLTYLGDLKPAKWIDMQFGLNIKNIRSKEHASGLSGTDFVGATDFPAYLGMRNPDGTPARLMAAVFLDEPSLSDPSLGLKDEGFVPLDELNMNYSKFRETYTRTYLHLNIYPVAGLKLTAMGQYEDISDLSEKEILADSYNMRHIYNLFTYRGKHLMPEGGKLTSSSAEANYYTLRFQANYARKFAERHDIDILAGYEYRQTFTKSQTSTLFGYDPQTLTNGNSKLNLGDLYNADATDLGNLYSAWDGYSTSEAGRNTWNKHRYMSYYATMHYTFDSRYALSGSYRIDECDLFGADKKFRRRPLWSVGLSWNAQNESFMHDFTWINVLKPRFSYGVTGNINAGYSSYLTAQVGLNSLTGEKLAIVSTPPNDQLRWEKTKTTNFGIDFALFNYRINGSLDIYNKQGSDVLSLMDVDPSTGFSQMLNNNAMTRNRGVELQFDADLLRASNRDRLGINLAFAIAYNKNKINKINYTATSGYSALTSYHEGYPVNSLYSYQFDHIATDDEGYQQIVWKKADGTTRDARLYGNADFQPDDVVFSGSLDPTWSGSLTPTISWKGLSLSAMIVWYAGHYLRPATQMWNYTSSISYGNNAPQAMLDWWNLPKEERDNLPGNGYMMSQTHVSSSEAVYSSANIAHADYAKIRNLVITYTFPRRLCRTLRMEQMRLRLQANDIVTWARNSAGIDPEAISGNGNLSYRTPRSYTLGLYVNF